MSFIYLFFGANKAEIEKEKFQYLKTVKLKIPRGRKSELAVSCQVVINPFCGLSVIFCGLISHLIGRETINIPEIFSGVHGFTEKRARLHGKFQPGLKFCCDYMTNFSPD